MKPGLEKELKSDAGSNLYLCVNALMIFYTWSSIKIKIKTAYMDENMLSYNQSLYFLFLSESVGVR